MKNILEVLCDSTLFTNRQRCIVLALCLFSPCSIQELSEKTKMCKDNLYREIRKLPFIQKNKDKKYFINQKLFENFTGVKIDSSTVNLAVDNILNCQNDSKELSKRQLKTVKMTLRNCQNDI